MSIPGYDNWKLMTPEEDYDQPGLTDAEQKAQGARCGCHGADDYCVCQNVTDATTRADRAQRGRR